jgi:putative aldouronate transport system substrate-binding protein
VAHVLCPHRAAPLRRVRLRKRFPGRHEAEREHRSRQLDTTKAKDNDGATLGALRRRARAKHPRKEDVMKKLLLVLCALAVAAVAFASPSSEGPATTGTPAAGAFRDKKVTLTYLYPLGSGFQVVDSMAQNATIMAANAARNVEIKFIHPPAGQENEQFNLILASKQYPDILTHGWGIPQKYPGGADKAITDGVYISLNKLIDAYAPNFKKILQSEEDVRKDVTTDGKDIWGFPMVDTTKQPQWTGPTIRKDLFDKAGQKVPETIGEWYTALSYFVRNKDQFPKMEAPLVLDANGQGGFAAFIGAYDVDRTFFQINGTVKFGPIEQGFKDYVTEMNKWYTEKIIHPDYAAGINRGAYITTDKCVALATGGFWEYDGWKRSATNPEFRVVGAPFPSLQKGKKVQISYMSRKSHLGYHTPITTACKERERAVDWIDWFYSEEGSLRANWGVEGDTFVVKNGQKVFTDKIAKNKEGVAIPIIYFKYLYSHGGFLREWDRENSSYGPDANECQMIWIKSTEANYMIPTFTSLTVAEAGEFTGIMGDVNTYVSEMMTKFITGKEPLANFAQFTNRIKQMNIDKAIAIQQAALKRFNAR